MTIKEAKKVVEEVAVTDTRRRVHERMVGGLEYDAGPYQLEENH